MTLQPLAVAARDVGGLHVVGIRTVQIQHAGRIAYDVLEPRREDRERVSQIQTCHDRLGDFV